MQLLYDLGLNQTVWIQLIFFLTTYVFLSRFLFRPYMRNLEYRKQNTHGNIGAVEVIRKEIQALEQNFQAEAVKQNQVTSELFGKVRKEAQSDHEARLTEAKAEASKLMTETRKKVQGEVEKARVSLKDQLPKLSAEIAGKVLGRELR